MTVCAISRNLQRLTKTAVLKSSREAGVAVRPRARRNETHCAALVTHVKPRLLPAKSFAVVDVRQEISWRRKGDGLIRYPRVGQ
jgi:hypothetical protein